MPRLPSLPLIDSRSYEDLVRQTEALARCYCKDWTPPAGPEPEPGRTLIQLFCRMARHVVGALNLQPERAQLAFLQLLGAERLPPTAARAPLTFRMVEGGLVETRVPAGTQVATASTEERPEERLFETEESLVLTHARLTSLFVRGADEEDTYAELSALLEGTATGALPAFAGETPDEHSLFVSVDSYFTLPSLEELHLRFYEPDEEDPPPRDQERLRLHDLPLEWSFWDGMDWRRVQGTLDTSDKKVKLVLAKHPPLAPCEVQGVRSCWLRAHCPHLPSRKRPPIIKDLMMTARSGARSEVAPGRMLFNTTPLEAGEFLPFGPLPRPGDTFYLECTEVLAWPGATVTVHVTLSAPPAAGVRDQVTPPRLVWECWDASRWVPALSPKDDTLSLTKGGAITFHLPSTVGPTEVNGQPGYWLRARLVSGEYGTLLEPHAPVIQQLTLSRTAGVKLPRRPGTCFSLNALDFEPIEIREGASPPSFTPFHRSEDTRPTLYLGFDQPFEPHPVTLFFLVEPPSPQEVNRAVLKQRSRSRSAQPRLVWEYFSKSDNGWRRLVVDDDTRAFSHSGQVRFIGPRDVGARAVFGQERYWLRVRWEDGTFQVMPCLRRVLTNTTWALHAVTISDEVLGSSDGSPEQAFFLTHAPVLLGQRIEVLEPEPPPPEERATLEREEGPDAVTAPPAGSTGSTEVRVRWHPVPDFHASGPTDRHYVIRHLTGAVRFGDGRRGRIPPRGRQNIRAAWYRTGGGTEGNVPAGSITQLRTTVPYVEGVEHLHAATGGTAAEGLERMRERVPQRIRHRDRAVTAQDFEDIAREASPDVARVRAITPPVIWRHAPPSSVAPGQVWLVIVPSGTGPRPSPDLELLRRVEDHVRARCAPAVGLRVVGPDWVQLKVTATLVVSSLDDLDLLIATARTALDRFLHPLTGGSDGEGWDFGRQPHHSDFYALLSAIPGIRRVSKLDFTGEVSPYALIFPGEHELSPVSEEGT